MKKEKPRVRARGGWGFEVTRVERMRRSARGSGQLSWSIVAIRALSLAKAPLRRLTMFSRLIDLMRSTWGYPRLAGTELRLVPRRCPTRAHMRWEPKMRLRHHHREA